MSEARIATGMLIPPQPPMSRLRLSVALAKRVRLASLFVWDHLQEFYPAALWDRDFTWYSDRAPSPHEEFDYQTLLGALGAGAGRMQLGIGVTEPIRRHPVLIAQAALTLAHLTKRAPIVGLGSGERMNTEPYGLSRDHAVDRLEEALQIVRRCLTSTGPIDFDGKHFQLHQARMDLRPPAGRIPQIWVAAHGPRMLRLTGHYGDGWLPMTLALPTPQEYAAKLDQIRNAANDAGRDPEAITPALLAGIVVAPTQRRARALLGSRLLRYEALKFPATHWHKLGYEHPLGAHFGGFSEILAESYDKTTLNRAIDAVPAEMVESGHLVGTPAQVGARLREFGEAGMRHVVLGPISAFVSRRDFAFMPLAVHRIAHLLRS
jgi:phthiodiolone/phenolphthiodiolone dimycocerosates ketoreductase